MKFPHGISLVAGLIALGGSAVASEKEGEIKTNAKGEQVICRTIKMTGTRMAKKVCRTAEEWKMVVDTSDTSIVRR